MKRLQRIIEGIGIGNKYFEPSDVSITTSTTFMTISVVNPEKILHTNDKSNFKEYFSFSGNEMGKIHWEVMNEVVAKDKYYNACVYVNTLEVLPEYRKTNAVWLLLDKFNEEIIQPLTQQHGKEKVCLTAVFANDKLAKLIMKYVPEKMGITWVEYGDLQDNLENVSDDDYELFMEDTLSNNPVPDQGGFYNDLIRGGYQIFGKAVKLPYAKTLADLKQIFDRYGLYFGSETINVGVDEDFYKFNELFAEFADGTTEPESILQATNFGGKVKLTAGRQNGDQITPLQNVYRTYPDIFDRVCAYFEIDLVQVVGLQQVNTLEELKTYFDQNQMTASRLKHLVKE